MSAKSDSMTWRSKRMPYLEKFSENSLKALSSRNRTIEREGSEDEEAPERKGFRAGVDLRLGAIDTSNISNREGEKERQFEKSQAVSNIKNIEKKYICIGNA